MRVPSLVAGLVIPIMAFASTQATAQQRQSASARAMLEEVVVTARRREESLETLPLSVQAITADAMQAQGVYNIQQLTEFVPNLVLKEDQRKNDTRFFVRGVGGGFSNPAQVFGVGMYLDGHYISGSLGAFMSTVDVERVEVLRGPQGTLFGKNTTGGAVSLVTAKPGPEFDSYVTLRAGDYGQNDLRAMVNVPLGESVFLRGNYSSEKNDGYYFNRFFGERTSGTDQESLGLALRWLPGENWTVDARLAISRDRDENQGGQCRAYPDTDMYYAILNNPANDPDADPSTWTPAPFAGPDLTLGTGDDIAYEGPGPFEFGEGAWGSNSIGNLRIDALYPGANAAYLNSCHEDFTSGDVYQTYQDYNTYAYADNEMFTLDAQWDSDGPVGAFDAMSVQLKGGWRYSSYSYAQDRDFGPGIIDHIGNHPKGSRGIARWTDEVEVIFNGDLSDRINLTAGLYWLDDDAGAGNRTCLNNWIAAYDPVADTINGMPDDNIICEGEGGTFFHRLPDSPEDFRSATNMGHTTGTSKALYAHMVYSFTDQWDLALGARYMEDDRTQAHIEFGIEPGSCTHENPGDPSPLGFCDPLYLMNRTNVLENGIHANVAATFSETTPTVSLTRHLGGGGALDSGIVYATISEGYLTGAFNDELNPNASAFTPDQRQNIIDIIPYGPEFLTNYELGFKGTFAGGNLRLATAIFLMDYTDKQEAIPVDNSDNRFGGGDPALEFTQNAANVEITGVEFELRSSPWDGGFVSLDLGVLDHAYKDFVVLNLDDPTGPLIDQSNLRTGSQTPDWTVTASLEHAFQLANGATLTPQIGVYAQDEMEWLSGLTVDQVSPHCHQDSYSKWRTRLTYEPAAANWQASLYGYNITDEEVLYRCAGIRSGSFGSWYEPPAWWGLEFTMRLGGG